MYELAVLFPATGTHGQLAALATTIGTGWKVGKELATTLGPGSSVDLAAITGAIIGGFIALTQAGIV
jgi:hypothetical protein